MVEVLVDGQFGYYVLPNMTRKGVSEAAKKAFSQAHLASRHSIFSFNKSARPAYKGKYIFPYQKIGILSAGDLNQLLLEAHNHLKSIWKNCKCFFFVKS